MGWEPGCSPSWALLHHSSRKWAEPATPTVSWPQTRLHSHRCSANQRHHFSGAEPARCVQRIAAIKYSTVRVVYRNISPPSCSPTETSRHEEASPSQTGDQTLISYTVSLKTLPWHRRGSPAVAAGKCAAECVCAQMGYASLDKCKSWQRADSKLHVPDGTQQKAQLHKSPLN